MVTKSKCRLISLVLVSKVCVCVNLSGMHVNNGTRMKIGSLDLSKWQVRYLT